MNWEAIGAIGEILGAIGVIASVLYLAAQVRRDRDATLANTRQLRQNGVRESMLTLANSDELTPVMAKIGAPSPPVSALMEEYKLTREEASRVNAFYIAMFRQLETNLRMPMTEEEFAQTDETIKLQLQGPAEVWWREARKSTFSKAFVDRANRLTSEGNL